MAIRIILLLLLLPLNLLAAVYTPENIPIPYLKDRSQYVSNPDGILSSDSVAKINRLLGELERKTGIQTIVAAVEDINPGDCFEFAHKLFTHHGIGQKGKDNGLVILLSTNERCIQFVTGYGLEGTLPDALCKRIQNQKMNSHLSKGDWDEGMSAGISTLATYLTDSEENAGIQNNKRQATENDMEAMMAIAIFFGIFIIISSISAHYANRCPKCHKHKLKLTKTELISKRAGMRTEQMTYVCTNCGNRVTRRKESNHGIGPMAGGTIIGGGIGRGGGFSGGSFGGGFSGGGGAGSRF